MSFAFAKRFGFACGVSLLTQGLWAAVQTTPYIAIHSQPKYAGLSVMPYANAYAPKGGYLSTASNGTFDNLNSMNGKGSST
jgi:microcin C transport system substrate-binding protein